MPENTTQRRDVVTRTTAVVIAIVALFAGGFFGFVLGTQYAPQPSMPQMPAQQQTKDHQAEIEQLEKQLASTPQDAAKWVQLGNLYYDSGKPDRAVDAYSKSLDIAPENPDVLVDRGVMKRQLGHPKEAVVDFDAALHLNPQHKTALFNKGVVLLHDLNEPKGAVESWELLLKIDPSVSNPGGIPLAEMIQEIKKSMPQSAPQSEALPSDSPAAPHNDGSVPAMAQ